MSFANEKNRRKLLRLLYALLFSLVFEGLFRKIMPSAGLFIFLLKDILCLYAIYIVVSNKYLRKQLRGSFILKGWGIVSVCFLPLFINTIFKDVLLGFFGLKQYLLYVIVALLIQLAFPPNKFNQFKKFVAVFSILLIPTTLVAMLQNSLPASHWLNLSVGGDSLEAFSASGFLRVSSTFSFTGQYSWFLNVVCIFVILRFYLPFAFKNKLANKIEPMMLYVLSIALLVGVFITGGRTAVLGCGVTLFLGFIFAAIKAQQRFVFRGIAVIFIFVASLAVLQQVKPEFFAAYNQRSSGYGGRTHSEEISERILDGFVGWAGWYLKQDTAPLLFGNGLGVMSNGSQTISIYASSIRENIWTETELATIVWEGGLYLLLLWYGFRIYIITHCFRIWKKMRNKTLGVPISFLFAYILIIGLYGTISMQPPLAIWWWLSIGAFFVIQNYSKHLVSLAESQVMPDSIKSKM